MEKSFTFFCVVFAVLCIVAAYALSASGFTFFRCAGSGLLTIGAVGYIVLAIVCARNVPNVTA